MKLAEKRNIIIVIIISLMIAINPLYSQKGASSKSKKSQKDKKKTEKVQEKKKDTEVKEEKKTDEVQETKKSTVVREKKKAGAIKSKQSPGATNILEPDDDSMSGTLEWKVVLKDDNGNVNLPERYRTWWYIRMDGVNTNTPTRLNIEGDGFAGKSIVLPVYSYDRINWHRFKPENIVSNTGAEGLYNYTIEHIYDSSSTVWVARYYPYSVSKLDNFLKTLEKNPFVKIEKIGESNYGRPINMVSITDPKVDDKTKKRIWVHSRTHPSETGSSFAVEGLIRYLTGKSCEGCKDVDLSKLIFNIVPMINPDGVALGNARVTPDSSYDLERMWLRGENDFDLKNDIPPEISAIHQAITNLNKKGPEFIIALNLHSKNAPPNWRHFLYSNFKEENKEYGESGDSLFKKQLSFARLLSNYYCMDTIRVRRSEEAGRPMDKKLFPEVWWWLNFKDKVMAATLETTSGIDGCFEEWVTFKDQEYLGEAIAKASYQYYKYYVSGEYFKYERPVENMEELMKFYLR
jgi:hypothetical protein